MPRSALVLSILLASTTGPARAGRDAPGAAGLPRGEIVAGNRLLADLGLELRPEGAGLALVVDGSALSGQVVVDAGGAAGIACRERRGGGDGRLTAVDRILARSGICIERSEEGLILALIPAELPDGFAIYLVGFGPDTPAVSYRSTAALISLSPGDGQAFRLTVSPDGTEFPDGTVGGDITATPIPPDSVPGRIPDGSLPGAL